MRIYFNVVEKNTNVVENDKCVPDEKKSFIHDKESRRILVDKLRKLKDTITADKPFATYKCHLKAAFGMLVVIYREGQTPLYLFINCNSQFKIKDVKR